MLFFGIVSTISTQKTKADLWQNKPCVLTKCLLHFDTTSTGQRRYISYILTKSKGHFDATSPLFCLKSRADFKKI